MKQTIEATKSGFEGIKKTLEDASHHSGSYDSDFFERLSDAVSATYVLLNDGMCEELSVCHTCAQNRDQLHDMMEWLDNEAAQPGSASEQHSHLTSFSNDINEVLVRIDKVLAELST